jgi:hypothetical protein
MAALFKPRWLSGDVAPLDPRGYKSWIAEVKMSVIMKEHIEVKLELKERPLSAL